jgi:hypothetical protein
MSKNNIPKELEKFFAKDGETVIPIINISSFEKVSRHFDYTRTSIDTNFGFDKDGNMVLLDYPNKYSTSEKE